MLVVHVTTPCSAALKYCCLFPYILENWFRIRFCQSGPIILIAGLQIGLN